MLDIRRTEFREALSLQIDKFTETLVEMANIGANRPLSFAEATRVKPSPVKLPARSKVVIVQPKGDLAFPASKKLFCDKLATVDNVKIDYIGRAGREGMAVEVDSDATAQKVLSLVKDSPELEEKLTGSLPKRRDPRIVLLGVETTYTNDELKTELVKSNAVLPEGSFQVEF